MFSSPLALVPSCIHILPFCSHLPLEKGEREKKKPPFETLNFAFVAIQTKNWKIDLSGNTIEIVV
jgi:hypothetical protein